VVNALAGSSVAGVSGTGVMTEKQTTASNVATAKPAIESQLNKKICAGGTFDGGWWVYDCDSRVLLIVLD